MSVLLVNLKSTPCIGRLLNTLLSFCIGLMDSDQADEICCCLKNIAMGEGGLNLFSAIFGTNSIVYVRIFHRPGQKYQIRS